MGDKRKQKRTTKKTNWENIRSWVGAILCIAIIVVIATYIAKLVPSSSAYTPGPVDIKPANGTPALVNRWTNFIRLTDGPG
jgi:anti-sigma-K factor RskA